MSRGALEGMGNCDRIGFGVVLDNEQPSVPSGNTFLCLVYAHSVNCKALLFCCLYLSGILKFGKDRLMLASITDHVNPVRDFTQGLVDLNFAVQYPALAGTQHHWYGRELKNDKERNQHRLSLLYRLDRKSCQAFCAIGARSLGC